MSEIELLPCDVMVAPATIIRKGCSMSTLLLAIRRRKNIDEHLTTWETPPRRSPPQVGRGMEEMRERAAKLVDEVGGNKERYGDYTAFIARQVAERIRALSVPPAEEGESPTAEDAARLILECADELISKATAEKLAERIRLLGTGSREERSQADLGERKMEKKR